MPPADTHHLSVKLPLPLYEQVKIIAAATDSKVSPLVVDAIEAHVHRLLNDTDIAKRIADYMDRQNALVASVRA